MQRVAVGIAGIATIIICIALFYFLIVKPMTTWEIELKYESTESLKLQVDSYGLTDWGNWGIFWVNGTVTWTGNSDRYIDDAKLSMYVYPKKGYKKTAHLEIWKLSLVYPADSYYTETFIPRLGGEQTPYPQSWNFSLSVVVYVD
ncbi:MAG: hypothetical protein QXL67_01785 [Candidatus Bathyarchaeia archaeon]